MLFSVVPVEKLVHLDEPYLKNSKCGINSEADAYKCDIEAQDLGFLSVHKVTSFASPLDLIFSRLEGWIVLSN